jgi:hypothetical protein
MLVDAVIQYFSEHILLNYVAVDKRNRFACALETPISHFSRGNAYGSRSRLNQVKYMIVEKLEDHRQLRKERVRIVAGVGEHRIGVEW